MKLHHEGIAKKRMRPIRHFIAYRTRTKQYYFSNAFVTKVSAYPELKFVSISDLFN